MDLRGKTVLVTGGARRIGAAIVRALAAEGANVVIHCNRSIDAAQALAADLRRSCAIEAFVVRRDLSEAGAGDSLFDETLEATGGRLDAIVNSASEYAVSAAATPSEEELIRAMRMHVDAPVALLRRLAGTAETARKAAVDILDARIARGDDKAHAAYMAAKRRLAALSPGLALELAPRVRLNSVAPGAVLEGDGESRAGFARLAAFNPMNALGAPEGLADCVLFLLRSDFVAGQILFYDGGYHLRQP